MTLLQESGSTHSPLPGVYCLTHCSPTTKDKSGQSSAVTFRYPTNSYVRVKQSCYPPIYTVQKRLILQESENIFSGRAKMAIYTVFSPQKESSGGCVTYSKS